MISTFVTLSDYCVLEFMAHPLGDPSPELITSTFYKLDNTTMDLIQVYNDDGDLAKTHNIKDITVAPIGGSRLALLDSDIAPEYQDYDASLTQSTINTGYSANLVFDTVRFHFASGFNFEEVGSVIVGVKHKLNDLRNFIFSNIVLDSITAEAILSLNVRPLYLGDAVYDKYIDIKIPSIKYLDDNFDQFGPNSFEYLATGGIGFIKNSPVTVFLQEANSEVIYGTNNIEYTGYIVTQSYEAAISQTNEFDDLGAVIQEAPDGDYIEYYATWNGAFPEDLISILNRRGSNQNWILIHQLQVYEQVGTAYIPSGNLVIYQEDNFGEPLAYRPILKNASVAVSMSIDYTLRLFNKMTSENIIRTGSMTIFNPNKYGKSLAKIELIGGPQSNIVYNKIQQTTFDASGAFNVVLGNTNTQIQIQERKVAAPVFFHKSNIALSSRNALITTTELGNEVVYGQGKMILPIDPTDNFIRFNIYKKVSTSTAPVPMSLNLNSSFKLSFGKNTVAEFTNMKDAAYENLQFGQIAFKIGKQAALKILDAKDDLFIITIISEDGTESMLYTGKWRSSTDYQSIIDNETAEASAMIESANNAELIKSLTDKVSQLEADVDKWKRAAASKSIKIGTTLVEPRANINAISAAPVVSAPSNNTSTTATVSAINSTGRSTNTPRSVIVKNNLGSNFGDSPGETGMPML
jgi:hypothetical protein